MEITIKGTIEEMASLVGGWREQLIEDAENKIAKDMFPRWHEEDDKKDA